MPEPGKIYIGTSGWHYKHWIGTYYPAGTKEKDQLSLYSKDFDTVEINNSFYHLPAIKTFKNWSLVTGSHFQFAVKGSRYITHMKKLKVLKAEIDRFLKRIDKLGPKAGPVLFQLPPHWKVNEERLSQFLSRLSRRYHYVFEFRNNTWYDEKVYDLLRRNNCAFCIYELAGHLSPLVVTANFVYVRLHGPGDKYQGSYTITQLKKWAGHCKGWLKEGKDVYVYFDNDQAGYAAFNALKLREMTNG
ncbi:MAG TPA: DUF72 domain-containing protein [Chitinophagaceae bacterium]|nr:DUF72 domain-containing protein [Chitinophagaceae bacterium]